MRTSVRNALIPILLLAGAAMVLTAFADPAEARSRRYVVHPSALIVDDWGHCWIRSRGVWWLTVCDRRFSHATRHHRVW